ncbi:helix-turn-helix transcriptional regulator [Arthrobacter sp. Leaf234]|uniref:helix-turn-helix transcriptional regulator n=1 Tax=Arthrobacter sp. Leaf234 TaxID=1736303 RepID=UPI0006FE8015|nr:helix-turn-helix transcriptional regulator [Arthrobacter sp. Leaf234]
MDQLSDHCEELVEALTRTDVFAATAEGVWLSERYREIVPAILPDVLRCLDTGDPLASTSVEAVRQSARTMLTADVPLRTVLHGGIPALRVFTAFLQSRHSLIPAARMATLLGRASLVATELAACWAASWAKGVERPSDTGSCRDGNSPESAPKRVSVPAARSSPVAIGADEVLAVIPVPGQLEQPDLDMVLLAAQGRSNEEIAQKTDYSTQAVKWHLGRVMREWKVRNRASLATAALLKGVIRPRPALTRTRFHDPSSEPLDGGSTAED